ncbi:hypothetical protein DSECCO2_647940 [anaerobic digester metagenome]
MRRVRFGRILNPRGPRLCPHGLLHGSGGLGQAGIGLHALAGDKVSCPGLLVVTGDVPLPFLDGRHDFIVDGAHGVQRGDEGCPLLLHGGRMAQAVHLAARLGDDLARETDVLPLAVSVDPGQALHHQGALGHHDIAHGQFDAADMCHGGQHFLVGAAQALTGISDGQIPGTGGDQRKQGNKNESCYQPDTDTEIVHETPYLLMVMEPRDNPLPIRIRP